MRRRNFPALFCLLFIYCSLVSLRAVQIGATRAQVVTELGKPASHAVRGDREILVYPKGVQLELVEGKVASARGLILSVEETTPTETVDPEDGASSATPAHLTGAKKITTPTPPPKPTLTIAPKPSPVPSPKPTPTPSLGSFETVRLDHPTPKLELAIALTMFGFHFVATLLGLRVAFRFWKIGASWSGTFAITGLDLLMHGLLQGLGPMSGGITTFAPVENGLAGIIMILTIRHFGTNKDLRDIIQTAYLVKFAVMLLKMFGVTAFLRAVLN